MELKKEEFLSYMEEIAPRRYAESFDNVGLLIDAGQQVYRRILLALDLTREVAQEAVEGRYDLVLTHHPIFFAPVQRLSVTDPTQAGAMLLLRHGISHFAAHTNFDSAKTGMNVQLCEKLGLQNHVSLEPKTQTRYKMVAAHPYEQAAHDWFVQAEALPHPDTGLTRMGELKTAVTLKTFARHVSDALGMNTLRFTGEAEKKVHKIAVSTGAGAGSMLLAQQAGAEVLLTGEVKHNQAIEANALGISLIEAGHYETERLGMEGLRKGLQLWIDQLQWDVTVQLSVREKAPMQGLL